MLDPSSGTILGTLSLPSAFPTLVVSSRGVVHLVSFSEWLARANDAARPVAAAFDLPTLDGGRGWHADLKGRVTVVTGAAGRTRRRAGIMFHYPGLPYTLLVDTRGRRIAGKWIGYLGPPQIDEIRAAARRESAVATRLHHTHPGSPVERHEHETRR